MLMLDKQNYGFDAFGTLIENKGTKTYFKKILKIFEKYEIDLKQIFLITIKFPEEPGKFFGCSFKILMKRC